MVRRPFSIAFAAAALVLAGPARPPSAFDLDRDDGIHARCKVEWWYHFGWLEDRAKNEWAWFSAFFLHPVEIRNRTYVLRYELNELIDMKSGRRELHTRIGPPGWSEFLRRRGGTMTDLFEVIPGSAAAEPGGPLNLAYGDDILARLGTGRYRLKAGPVDLQLRSEAEPLLAEGVGMRGYPRLEDMRYYSIPDLEAAGTLRGEPVRGRFWYDHEWGNSYSSGTYGWAWWGLQLDTGPAVAYVIFDAKSGRELKSVLTFRDRVISLKARPTRWWLSGNGVRYPLDWSLSAGPLRLEIHPLFDRLECPVAGGPRWIWEGPVQVTGTASGRGFQELFGYDRL